MKDTGERLQKWLATRGFGSRREIENWIRAGRLLVNGKVATLGQRVSGEERFVLDNKPLHTRTRQQAPATQILMYNKPLGEIVSQRDPQGRRTVFQSLPKLRQGRWIAIGRLDINTTGLILFTNNGELAHRMMHPSYEVQREYWVRVAGTVTEETLAALRGGVPLDSGEIAKFEDIIPLKNLDDDAEGHYNRYFSVILQEGKNREVRRLWEAVGCQVSRLKRVGYGGIYMPKYLAPGKFIALEAHDIKALMASLQRKKPKDKPKNEQ